MKFRIAGVCGSPLLPLGALALLTSSCATSPAPVVTRPEPPAVQRPERLIPSAWPTADPARQVISQFADLRDGGRRTHKGIDIAAPYGTPVHATAPGQVTFSGTMNGYGKSVVLDHGSGIETLYAHLSERRASEGERVGQGEVIGRVGQTGNATTPHVHYEIRLDGAPVNPGLFLTGLPGLVTAKNE